MKVGKMEPKMEYLTEKMMEQKWAELMARQKVYMLVVK